MRWLAVVLFLSLGGCTSGPDLTGWVEGTALIGPTCPVERDPPEPGCEDRPYHGGLAVFRSPAGSFVSSFVTQENGTFRIGLPPGTYEVRSPAGTSTPPTCSSPPFTVSENGFVAIEVSCDSGIR
jgi:hypothetical protein